jgi:hypothetical protein
MIRMRAAARARVLGLALAATAALLVSAGAVGFTSSASPAGGVTASRYAVPAVRHPITTNPRSDVAHDTEVMALVGHSGRLFAATDQWEYPGPSPAGHVLVKNSPKGPWRSFEQAESGRVQALDSFHVPRDQGLGGGHSLLVTQAVIDGQSRLQWLRDRANSFSRRNSYALSSPAAKVRAFGTHEDGGGWAVYAGVTPTGILRGAWSPRKHTLVFDPKPELTAAPPGSPGLKTQKVTGFADCGGALYTSINTNIYRRNDGKLAPGVSRWVMVYEGPTVGKFNSGLRGLTCVQHRGSPSLLASTEGDGEVFRFDHLPKGDLDQLGTPSDPGRITDGLKPIPEFSPIAALRKMLADQGTVVPESGAGSIDYVIAAYNDFKTVRIAGVKRQAFGLEWHYSGPCPSSRSCTPASWDAAACFAVRTDHRRSPANLALRCLSGPQFTPSGTVDTPVRSGQAFVSIRTIERSPFGRDRLYYGGYDTDFYPADGTAWVGSSRRNVLHPPPAPTRFSWVKDTVKSLNVWLPDANSSYYLGGFGTANGARTVIRGRIPDARYWSFTAYPIPPGGPVGHAYDTQIAPPTIHRSSGNYKVTIAANCSGIAGACIATTADEPAGIAVLRLYVPTDLAGSATGGVRLPAIDYESATGSPLSLTEAAGTSTIQGVLDAYHGEHGALPAELTKSYPPALPVPTPIVDPPPSVRIAHGAGAFNNPDNVYQHAKVTTTRGNLVVSAVAPTYRSDSSGSRNDLGRAAGKAQVRYWSLCMVLDGLHTGNCLRDSQIRFPRGSRRFTAIVAPECPVAGYRNCLVAGPEPLQVSVAYRLLLPAKSFEPKAFQGRYGMTAGYVARPG